MMPRLFYRHAGDEEHERRDVKGGSDGDGGSSCRLVAVMVVLDNDDDEEDEGEEEEDDDGNGNGSGDDTAGVIRSRGIEGMRRMVLMGKVFTRMV